MTSPIVAQQPAIFPDLARNSQIADKDGNITAPWRLFFQQLAMALQTNYKPEGIVFPQQSATNIGLLTNETSKANLIYDSTNQAFNANITNTATGNRAWYQVATIFHNAGNPNNVPSIAGNVDQLCRNTLTNTLYICTTAGGSGAAVWTAV